MKLNVSNLKDILELNLTVYQRGLILSFMLVKEKDPKLTLAKFKAVVNMKEAKMDLIDLHERKILQWSGYKTAKKSSDINKHKQEVNSVIEFMNNLYGRRFDPESKKNMTVISARLEEGHTVDELKKVVSNRWTEWKDSSTMKKHLNPTTIFRPSKFEKYYEDMISTGVGTAVVEAEKIGLKDGDPILYKHIDKLIDSELYRIMVFSLTTEPKARHIEKILGKDLKSRIKKEFNKVNRGDSQDFKYHYKPI